MHQDVERVLVTKEELDQITTKLAEQITNDYKDSEKPLILITILKGSMLFASDLMKKIDLPMELEFMKVSSYGEGTKTSGEIKIHLDLMREKLEQYDLLIVEERRLHPAAQVGFYAFDLFEINDHGLRNAQKICAESIFELI